MKVPNSNETNITTRDINTTYLIALTSIIESLVESGAVNSEYLAKKIEAYAEHIGPSENNKNVKALSGNFANIARNAKPKGD